MRLLATPPTPTPFSTASFITRFASNSSARACAERAEKEPNPLDQKPERRQIYTVNERGPIVPESPGAIIPLQTGAFVGIGKLRR